ncbi:RNA recognition motif. (a.k.a. RRM, RBD, or RNP domain)/Zinc knuckle, putative [Angomonas deanei]|uniref:RNA recognition motif. (A.k.a. RRM, RBD, or RNP domain)/Zinc knuckle, putative n=1 Tax=Angomonas deanei TaxID=59799 RepID=A0A7G2CQT8_9TRYP|nr:RNA recognition motif. (a.k.a. RRM, RBD, or RNP domain)/Zinc knuckle, putative [Angomonas deanei]
MSLIVNVSGLPTDVTQEAVSEYFSRAGHVVAVSLKEAGAATVEFDRDEDVEAAVQLNNSEFAEGVTIQVSRGEAVARRSRSRSPSAEKGPDYTAVVLKLPPTINEPELREIFGACGEITNIRVDDRRTRYAFITFATEEALNKAVELNGTEHGEHKLEVEKRRPRPGQGFRIVGDNIPPTAEKEELRELFSRPGVLLDFFLAADNRVLYATYATKEEMDKALELNDTEIAGGKILVKPRASRTCFKCGKEGHISAQCRDGGAGGRGAPRRDIECHRCGRRGHIARECRSAPSRYERGGPSRRDDYRDDRRDRRRRRSDSYDRDRRRHSRSRSPPRRRYSRSRSPPRRHRRSYTPSRSRSPPRRR